VGAGLNQPPIQQRIERSEDRALRPERAVDEPSFMGSRGQLAGCPQGPRADQHRRLPLAARLAKQRASELIARAKLAISWSSL
jgi:hypothetical protein